MVVDLPLRSFLPLTKQKSIRYFTLAHEIAHNLVQPHNSEHEFYSFSICQRFLMGLVGLIIAEQAQMKESHNHILNKHKVEREAT